MANVKTILAVSVVLLIGGLVQAAPVTIDISPAWSDANGGRVSYQGFKDYYWFNVDVANTNVQQYVWMNIGTAWKSSVTGTITSATLSWTDASANFSSPAVNFKIFEVPGTADTPDYGRTPIDNFNGAAVTGGELVAWFAAHTGYGNVTIAQVNQANTPVSFDITALLEGWRTNTLNLNQGYMMILNDTTNGGSTAWGPGGTGQGGGPTISVTYDVPEPATMSLLALGGLAALIRRRK